MYLHPNKNPTAPFVSPVLDVNNFQSWYRFMTTTLSAKNKLQFIDGIATEPDKKDPLYQTWKHCNDMAVSWISHSVSPSIRQSILWMDIAEAIQNDLKSRYFQGDHMCISYLQLEASSTRQGELTVIDFFTNLRIIWDEIDNFRPDPTCSCLTKCFIGMIGLINQRKSEDRVMQFLRGLNEQYTNVKSHVLLLDHIPPISKIFSYVAQQKRQIMGNNPQSEINIKIIASNMQITCNYYGKSGHNESICFKKNCFPPNYEGKNSRNFVKRTCTHCGKNGHTIDVCYKKHGLPPRHKFFNNKANSVNGTNGKHEEKQEHDVGD